MSDLLHDEEAFTDEAALALQLCGQQLSRLVYAMKCLGNAISALADAIRDHH